MSAGLLLASAVAAACATSLHWLPCRGSMLSGSIVRGYAYGPDFSDACLRRMDEGMPFFEAATSLSRTPWAAELGSAAMLLAGTAWLVPVLASRRLVAVRVVLALPGVATVLVALLVAAALAVPAIRGVLDTGWLWSVDLLALAVAVAVVHDGHRDWGRRVQLRLLAVLWGSTAFGMIPQLFSYGLMTGISDATWDVPPGTGYLTAVVLVLATAGTLLTLVGERSERLVVSPETRPATVP